MTIFAIDPGTTESSAVAYDGRRPVGAWTAPNEEMLDLLDAQDDVVVAIEMVASYGMPVGREVFETCVWIGRFAERCAIRSRPWGFVYRKDVKTHLCGDSRAKDSNIRQALLDIFGGNRQAAIGTKKKPGPCYGISGDQWAALAVAVTLAGGGAPDPRFRDVTTIIAHPGIVVFDASPRP